MRANRGYALKLIGFFAQARTDLDEAVRLNPSEPFFQQQRADIYSENGAFDEAIRTYSKALQHTAAYARFWRAVAYALKGDIDRAISEFKAVYADGDSDAIFKTAAEWALGFVYFQKDDLDKAIEAFTKFLRTPDPWILAERGKLYLRQGRYKLAVADFHRIDRIEQVRS